MLSERATLNRHPAKPKAPTVPLSRTPARTPVALSASTSISSTRAAPARSAPARSENCATSKASFASTPRFSSAVTGRERLTGKHAPAATLRAAIQEPFMGKNHSTAFGTVYTRGGIPCRLQHGSVQHRIQWTTSPPSLSFPTLLPLFIVGLLETHPQYRFIAHQGLMECISAPNCGDSIQQAWTVAVPPLRGVLGNSGDKGALLTALKALAAMIPNLSIDSLLSACGMLLPPLSRLAVSKDREVNDATHSMLRTLEERALEYPQVLKLIKARIPTYTSIRSC
ncbi:hypothetical protein SeLEV6574_g03789 [Synchytrium endobioticum]|nr:hypothetical protein SeLEV6574_g03789 [Synchytrium endobioticum]